MADMKVRIPAKADYVHVLRSVLTAAAARAKLSVDEIEDLRLALGEACALLIGQSGDGSELQLEVTTDDGRLDVVTRLDAPSRTRERPMPHQTVIWHILSALADEARLEETAQGPAIHLTKLLPAS